MKNFYSLLTLVTAILLLAACDTASIVQPTHNGESSQDVSAEIEKSVPDAEAIPGQYIVVLEDPWDGEISEEVAGVARELISSVRADFAIPDDSVKSEYEYALRGFTARMSEETVEQLNEDTRVNYVVQDWWADPLAAVPAKTADETSTSSSASS